MRNISFMMAIFVLSAPPSGQITFPRIILPPQFRKTVINNAHTEVGHQGGRKTLYSVQRTYKWGGQWRSIQSELRRCALCRVHSLRQHYPPPSDMPIAHYPGQVMALDIVGPLTPTQDGMRYLLTAIDHCSGWLDTTPIRAKTQREVYRYVRNDLVPRYGSPEILITDQGLEFRGRGLGAYLKMVGTDHRRSSPYHPQTNGKLERAHRTLKAILRKCVNSSSELWKDQVGAALWAYRITRHDTTGYSPYFLQYGRESRVPLTRFLATQAPDDDDAVRRFDVLADAFKRAAASTEASRRHNRQRLARRALAEDVAVGDKVVIRVNERAPLDPHWDYLYTVVVVRGPVVSVVDQRTGRRKVLNREKLLLVDPDLDWGDSRVTRVTHVSPVGVAPHTSRLAHPGLCPFWIRLTELHL